MHRTAGKHFETGAGDAEDIRRPDGGGAEQLSRSPGAATYGSVLPHTGGRALSGHATRGGAPAATRHTTQGTSAGPVDTGKPAGLVTRRWVSRWGLPGGIGGEPHRGRLVAMPVPSAVS